MLAMSKKEKEEKMTKKAEAKGQAAQSLGDMADELFGGSDSDDEHPQVDMLKGSTCEKEKCACFLCRQNTVVNTDRIRYVLRKKDEEIAQLKEEIKKLKSK